MPRRLEFDPKDALTKAMPVFWQKGVEATSIGDLVEATGVQRSGLYSVFGNKEGVFAQSLDLYFAQIVQVSFDRLLGHPKANIDSIRDYFFGFQTLVDDRASHIGCLMCLTAMSSSKEAQAIHTRVDEMLEEVQGYFIRALDRSQKAGEIHAAISTQQLSKALLGHVLALANMCRARAARPLVKPYVGELMTLIDGCRKT